MESYATSNLPNNLAFFINALQSLKNVAAPQHTFTTNSSLLVGSPYFMKLHALITGSHDDASLLSGSTQATSTFSASVAFIRTSWIWNRIQSSMFSIPWNSRDLFAFWPREDRDSIRMVGLCVAKCGANLPSSCGPDQRSDLSCYTDRS